VIHAPSAPDQDAWLMLTTEQRIRQSNDGYDDDPASHYSWDSTVPHRDHVQVSDVIVLWDGRTILGASVIERIDQGQQTKPVYRCPHCGRSAIKLRKRNKKLPYRCQRCESEFRERKQINQEVKTYRSEHEAGWVDLAGALEAAELRSLCQQPKAQGSIRPLDWPRFQDALRVAHPETGLMPLRAVAANIRGGHRDAVVRVRVGQRAFRQQLLSKYGDVCAFTGRSPLATLEAAHLYSYAAEGVHHDQGGFLLRRDLHTLFDQGMLAVRPDTLQLDVDAEVRSYAHYAALQGTRIAIDLTSKQTAFIERHWKMCRTP
jgi:predicted RNA-binding Zn-ribbon protein involved in translation (DUF1610 family)